MSFFSFCWSSGRRKQVQPVSKGTIHNFWQYRQEIAVAKWICIIYPSSLLCNFMLQDLLLTQKFRSMAASPVCSTQGQFVLWLTRALFLMACEFRQAKTLAAEMRDTALQLSSWGLNFYFTGPRWLKTVLQNVMLPFPSEGALILALNLSLQIQWEWKIWQRRWGSTKFI